MKTAFRKLASLNKNTILRNLAFSVMFILFFVVVIYILINSPA
jgi:hypothetical protein